MRDLGPVLGAYHPVGRLQRRRLLEISGLDEVSFHMSGTEAVMQAVRLARYHTRRSHLVRFCGAYHGWWGDVQPGVGNPLPAHETYTLKDMDEAACACFARRRDIACVLVNPLQALHPNASAPGDSTLIDSGRSAHFDRAAYSAWLAKLRAVCSAARHCADLRRGVRRASGSARAARRNISACDADMVTYGKTVAGGLPVGVLCGRRRFMRRFQRGPARGHVLGEGNLQFAPLRHGIDVRIPAAPRHRSGACAVPRPRRASGTRRAQALNERLRRRRLPVRVANLSSIWTICYGQPSRYNWMFQYYLRAAGLT